MLSLHPESLPGSLDRKGNEDSYVDEDESRNAHRKQFSCDSGAINLDKAIADHTLKRRSRGDSGKYSTEDASLTSGQSLRPEGGQRKLNTQKSEMFRVNEPSNSFNLKRTSQNVASTTLHRASLLITAASAIKNNTSLRNSSMGAERPSATRDVDEIEMTELGKRIGNAGPVPEQQDDQDSRGVQEMRSLEIAAYAHLQQWVRNAELCHRVLRAKVMQEQQAECNLCDLVCCGCCKRCKCKFRVRVALCWRCCPGGYCLSGSKAPLLPKVHGAFADEGFADAVKVEQLYPICCCGPRFRLSLLSAPFIWIESPLAVVVNRVKLMFTVLVELASMALKLVFVISVVRNQMNQNDNDHNVGPSFVVATLGVFLLPHVLHTVWVLWAPGYDMRGSRRKIKQIMLGLPFLRPLYEFLWTSKFLILFPYLTIRDEGWIVADNGMHERWMTWRNVHASTREIPMYLIEGIVLVEFFPFWGVPDIFKFLLAGVTNKFESDVKTESACHQVNIDPNLTVLAMLFGLVTAGVTMIDQIERDMPSGAWSRYIPRLLSDSCCGSAALIWNILLVFIVFIDLFLKLIVFVPFLAIEGVTTFFGIFIILVFVQSLMTWQVLAATKKETEAKSPLSSEPVTRSNAMRRSSFAAGRVRSASELANGQIPDRGRTDAYDAGLQIEKLSHRDPACCCCCCCYFRRRRNCCCFQRCCDNDPYGNCWGPSVESMPFVLQGVWVDLPWRLKFLRLAAPTQKISDRHNSTTIFLASSIKSVVVLILLLFWNQSEIKQTWEEGATKSDFIKCSQKITSTCLSELFAVGGRVENASSPSLRNCFSDHDLCSLDSFQCPVDFVPVMEEYNIERNKSRKEKIVRDTWLRGVCCVCDSGLVSNTSASSSRSQQKGHACIPEMTGALTRHNHVNIDFWRFMLISHDAEAAASHDRLPWIVVTFWSMISAKLFLTGVIVVQMRCTKRGREGRFDCCWKRVCPTSDDKGEDAEGEYENQGRTERNRPSGSNSSHLNQLKRYATRDRKRLWQSELRARDVQLILRVATIMPRWKVSAQAISEDVDRVEIAKYILGSGGEDMEVDGDGDVVTDNMIKMMSMEGLHASENNLNRNEQSEAAARSSIEIQNPAYVDDEESLEERDGGGEEKRKHQRRMDRLARMRDSIVLQDTGIVKRGILPSISTLDRHRLQWKDAIESNRRRSRSLTDVVREHPRERTESSSQGLARSQSGGSIVDARQKPRKESRSAR